MEHTTTPGAGNARDRSGAPRRVLHVVAQMVRCGGAETWLMQLLRGMDPHRVQMDFLVGLPEAGHYDAEIRSLGSKVILCPNPSRPLGYASRLGAVLREGRYDVVHSHLHHYSGFVLGIAKDAGVPIRIAHSHSDTALADRRAGLLRHLYLAGMKAAIRRHATHGLAVSQSAAVALFGPRWREDRRWSVLHCALDFSRFRAPFDRAVVRAGLGLPAEARVIGHVGRFDVEKNHRFLLRIAAEVLRRDPAARFVLVGDGPLRRATEAEATRLGIRDRLVFTGIRSDVPDLLRSMDLFLFPSLYEGLPLAGLEAQAAALPIVLSDVITRELVLVPDLFAWRSLADPPEAWATTVLDALQGRGRAPDHALALIERTDFSLGRSLPVLQGIYAGS